MTDEQPMDLAEGRHERRRASSRSRRTAARRGSAPVRLGVTPYRRVDGERPGPARRAGSRARWRRPWTPWPREYCGDGRHGIELVRLAGGWAFRTDARCHRAVSRLFETPEDSGRLSPAALECLAVVAYLQPVSRPQIAEIRGVNSDSTVHTLLERELITEVGRSAAAGRRAAVRHHPAVRGRVRAGRTWTSCRRSRGSP